MATTKPNHSCIGQLQIGGDQNMHIVNSQVNRSIRHKRSYRKQKKPYIKAFSVCNL